ncbi:MAG: 3-methyl-2-oxobutanoate dehydrogenase subunit VorB [Clostridiales Family XIII bacterium]|nr:3-methyl-2-oxobutanoate dehydrogenase subunit VorB [Clostridiales Family XIII bacterium]
MARMLMKGNEAVAEAAIACGCRYFFGYPITPQNEIPETMSKRLPEVGGVYVQAESEVASINMVYGAAGCGARVMTSSSSVGIALMQEGISYMVGAELPAVIVNMMRGGPGLGSIQPSQGDYNMSVKGGGSGDYKLLTYTPGNVQETCDLVQRAFDRAAKYRTVVQVIADGIIGQMMEPIEIKTVEPVQYDDSWASKGWDYKTGRGFDGQERPKSIINSLYIEPEELEVLTHRLFDKYAIIEKEEVMYEEYKTEGAEILFVAYGSVSRIVKNVIEVLESKGIKAGLVRPITAWPFPSEAVYNAANQDSVKKVIVTEMSAGQMLEDVRLAVRAIKPVSFYGRVGSQIPTPEEIVDFAIADLKKDEEFVLGGR